mgnify:CR=1 FL=1
MNLGLKTTLPISFADARMIVIEALKAEGFGVLTDINVKETIKQKLGADFMEYEILGACNPPLAHKALSTNPDVGLLLPCNVILYSDGSGTTVNIVDPDSMVAMMPGAGLEPVAAEAKARLSRVLESIQK